MLLRHFKRKGLIFVLSTVFLVTTALHTFISFEWSRKQFSDVNGPEEFLLREGRRAKDNNGNGVRQLASYETHNDNFEESTLVMMHAQVEMPDTIRGKDDHPQSIHMQKPGPVLQDIKGISVRQNKDDQDDEIEFRDCSLPGTLDMSAYPFVDARAIYCGDSKKANNVRPPGAIPLYLLTKIIENEGINKEGEGMNNIEIAVEPPIIIKGVVVEEKNNFVKAEEFSVTQKGINYRENNRKVNLRTNKEYSAGPLLFFPPILSEQWALMIFLRTIYKECAVTSTHIAATVKHVSVQGNSISGSFCVFLEIVGGGIKNSYVLWQNSCTTKPLSKKMTKCIVSDISI